MCDLNELYSMCEEENINKYDLLVFLDKKFFDSENTYQIQKDMHDCVTFINQKLGYFLKESIEESSKRLEDFIFLDITDATGFLCDTLSPMTKMA